MGKYSQKWYILWFLNVFERIIDKMGVNIKKISVCLYFNHIIENPILCLNLVVIVT